MQHFTRTINVSNESYRTSAETFRKQDDVDISVNVGECRRSETHLKIKAQNVSLENANEGIRS